MDYGLGGSLNQKSVFFNRTNGHNLTLGPPVLNISVFRSEAKFFSGQNSAGLLNMTWVRDNLTYDYDYIKTHGKCQNTGVSCVIILSPRQL